MRVREVEAPDEVRAAPGKDLVELASPAFAEVVGVGDGGEQGRNEPHTHGQIPDGEAEALQTGAIEEQNGEDSGEADDRGFGDEVVGFEAGAEDPKRKVVAGGWLVVGSGKNGPSPDKIDEQGQSLGKAAEEQEIDGNPGTQGDQRGNDHADSRSSTNALIRSTIDHDDRK